jgi:hypothetical protein
MFEIYDHNIHNWMFLEVKGVDSRWTELYIYMADIILTKELNIYG